MADKKKVPASSTENGHTLAWEALAVVFLIMVIGGTIGGKEIYSKFVNISDDSEVTTEGDLSFFGKLFPSGILEIGQEVMNKGEVVVRGEPGGQIIGTQEIRAIGKILAGPIEKFNKIWWRVDYENPPDGWVYDQNLTNKILLFSAFNIVPLTLGILKPFFIFLSIVLIVLIFFVSLKKRDLQKMNQKKKEFNAEQERMKHHGDEVVSDPASEISDLDIGNLPTGSDAPRTENVNNRRWSNIQTLINSHSVNDWKQAIIEADIILYDLLDRMGYKGDSIGDKLKTVEPSDFLTLDKAWEAHKIRNRIAHKGSEYVLSRDDAEKAIELYREVFSEFYFI